MLGKVEICGVNTSRLQTLSNEEMMRLIELAQKGDQAAKQRLVEGKNVQASDIVLLQHEYYELTIMAETGCVYEIAHEIAEQKYNWRKALSQEKQEE